MAATRLPARGGDEAPGPPGPPLPPCPWAPQDPADSPRRPGHAAPFSACARTGASQHGLTARDDRSCPDKPSTQMDSDIGVEWIPFKRTGAGLHGRQTALFPRAAGPVHFTLCGARVPSRNQCPAHAPIHKRARPHAHARTHARACARANTHSYTPVQLSHGVCLPVAVPRRAGTRRRAATFSSCWPADGPLLQPGDEDLQCGCSHA